MKLEEKHQWRKKKKILINWVNPPNQVTKKKKPTWKKKTNEETEKKN